MSEKCSTWNSVRTVIYVRLYMYINLETACSQRDEVQEELEYWVFTVDIKAYVENPLHPHRQPAKAERIRKDERELP